MAKFTPEERIEAAKRYLEGNESYQFIADSLGTVVSNVKNLG